MSFYIFEGYLTQESREKKKTIKKTHTCVKGFANNNEINQMIVMSTGQRNHTPIYKAVLILLENLRWVNIRQLAISFKFKQILRNGLKINQCMRTFSMEF